VRVRQLAEMLEATHAAAGKIVVVAGPGGRPHRGVEGLAKMIRGDTWLPSWAGTPSRCTTGRVRAVPDLAGRPNSTRSPGTVTIRGITDSIRAGDHALSRAVVYELAPQSRSPPAGSIRRRGLPPRQHRFDMLDERCSPLADCRDRGRSISDPRM